MEIGSAYALQVCLLQIPALVAVSAFLNRGKQELQESTFSLIFPRWDLITVILCVFLLAYMYGEGKSNYFKVASPPRPCPDRTLLLVWRFITFFYLRPVFRSLAFYTLSNFLDSDCFDFFVGIEIICRGVF
jgi:hypothetical protein